MIRFNLICEGDHEFDGWFSSSDDFDQQCKRGLVTCPLCNSSKIEKSLMAPSVSTSRSKENVSVARVDETQKAMISEMRKIRDTVLANSEDVGNRFPDEVRKMHYGESETRGIHGEASRQDVGELLEEGIGVLPLPQLPEDAN